MCIYAHIYHVVYIVSSILYLVSSILCGLSRSKRERTKWRDPFWGERGPAKKEEKVSQPHPTPSTAMVSLLVRNAKVLRRS